MNDSSFTIDKITVARNFSRAASTYDEVATLQKEVGLRLLERCDFFNHSPKTILDLGSGTGYFSLKLKSKFPKATIFSMDLAEGMLAFSKDQLSSESSYSLHSSPSLICADAEQLPLQNQTIDLIFSNCTFQWCTNLFTLFQELNRVLTPEGLLLFSTLGPDSLKELQECKQESKEQSMQMYKDMHMLGDLLLQNYFQNPVMEMEYFTLLYNNLKELRQDLKQLGAQEVKLINNLPRSSSGDESENFILNKRQKLRQLIDAYEHYRTEGGHLPATFEIIYGTATQSKQEKETCAVKSNQPFIPTKLIVDQKF